MINSSAPPAAGVSRASRASRGDQVVSSKPSSETQAAQQSEAGATTACPAGGTTGTYRRRKFVAKSHFGKSSAGRNRHVKLSAVQQALEEDSAAVETLKRDVAEFQHLELDTSRRYLMSLQKTYDKLKSEADAREAQQLKYQEDLALLDKLCTEARLQSSNPNPKLTQLQREVDQEEQLVKDAIVQKDVFGHMIKRLSAELLEARQSGHSIDEQLEGVEREIAACTAQLHTARQESKHEELKYEKLAAQVATRRKMQESRLNGIQRVIAERSSLVEKQEERMKMREAVMARSKFDLGAQEEQRLKRMHVIRKVYSSMLEKKITAEEESLGALETTFQKIKIVTGLSDVDEIVQKFKERTQKTQQLSKQANEVRQRIDALRESNGQLRERLFAIRAVGDGASRNREMYREMDSFNKGLNKVMKHCEEAKERAIRSNVTLEQLKLAVARFRSKIDGKPYPPPDTAKLPEYLRELDIKLTGIMKSVSEALALDETNGTGTASAAQGEGSHLQGDRAIASDSVMSSDGNSATAKNAVSSDNASLRSGNEVLLPFGKMQSEKLQKMLYHKLMLTNPDQGPRNVRVRARPDPKELERYAQLKLMTQGLEDCGDIDDDSSEFAHPAAPSTNPQQPSILTAADDAVDNQQPPVPRRCEPTNTKEDETREPVVDRKTIKRLSSLIVNREEPKKRRNKRPSFDDTD